MDIDPSSELVLSVQCPPEAEPVCSSSASIDPTALAASEGGVSFRWKVQPLCSTSGGDPASVVDWDRDTETGNAHDRLVIKPNVFRRSAGRKTYEISVQSTRECLVIRAAPLNVAFECRL